MSYNILISCDELYYNTWAINCIRSILHYNSWISVTVIVIAQSKVFELDNVQYIYDTIDLSKLKNPVAYFQACRFLKCVEIFPNNELVMSIDCDTLCTKSFSKNEFIKFTEEIHVLRHHKANRWMAGLVTYGVDNNFRERFKNALLNIPIENWSFGHDQTMLNVLNSDFQFKKTCVGEWMSFGRGKGIFLTLKGDQKTGPGYLNTYQTLLKIIG